MNEGRPAEDAANESFPALLDAASHADEPTSTGAMAWPDTHDGNGDGLPAKSSGDDQSIAADGTAGSSVVSATTVASRETDAGPLLAALPAWPGVKGRAEDTGTAPPGQPIEERRHARQSSTGLETAVGIASTVAAAALTDAAAARAPTGAAAAGSPDTTTGVAHSADPAADGASGPSAVSRSTVLPAEDQTGDPADEGDVKGGDKPPSFDIVRGDIGAAAHAAGQPDADAWMHAFAKATSVAPSGEAATARSRPTPVGDDPLHPTFVAVPLAGAPIAPTGETVATTGISGPAGPTNASVSLGELADSLSPHLIRLASGRGHEVVLQLHPPALGDVTVRVLVDGRDVSAWFASPHAQVQQAISGAIGQLHANLGNAGYNLNGAWVGADAQGPGERDRDLPAQRQPSVPNRPATTELPGLPVPSASSKVSVYV